MTKGSGVRIELREAVELFGHHTSRHACGQESRFQRLPKPPHINDLWESQSEALKMWTERRTENDLVIKLNTDGGKTLVGLLISQALLHELRQPVLYLCPNKQLVRQTVEKGAEIGLATQAYEAGPGSSH
jgi:replicative superfamily II helicase